MIPLANYQLVNGVNTFDLVVTNAAALHGFTTRGQLRTSPQEIAWFQGDGVDVVTPISCELLIHAATEAAARAELKSIAAFAEDAEYIRRASQSSWRALHGSGLSLLSFTPEVMQGATSRTWTGTLTLLPLFALFTSAQVRTDAAYAAEVTAGTVHA